MRTKIFLATFIFLIFIPDLSMADTVNSKEFQRIIKQLDMQGHSEDELSTCRVKQIYYDEVAEMLNSGMSEKEIIQSYVDEYGQAALKSPGSDKSGFIAWGMPAAGFAAGIAIVALWLKKLTGKADDSVKKSAQFIWESETEREISEKIFDEERRKHF